MSSAAAWRVKSSIRAGVGFFRVKTMQWEGSGDGGQLPGSAEGGGGSLLDAGCVLMVPVADGGAEGAVTEVAAAAAVAVAEALDGPSVPGLFCEAQAPRAEAESAMARVRTRGERSAGRSAGLISGS